MLSNLRHWVFPGARLGALLHVNVATCSIDVWKTSKTKLTELSLARPCVKIATNSTNLVFVKAERDFISTCCISHEVRPGYPLNLSI